jgi:hypothetical protein
MNAHALRMLLRAVPFRPFRLRCTDGAYFDIHHPDEVLLYQSLAEVAVAPFGTEIAERTVIISLLHLIRLEPIDGG